MRNLLWAAAVLVLGCGEEVKPHEVSGRGIVLQVFEAPPRIVVRDAQGNVLFEGLPGGEVAEGEEPLVALAMRHSDSTVDTGFGTFRVEDRNPGAWRSVARFSDVREGSNDLDPYEFITFRMLDAAGTELGDGLVGLGGSGTVEIRLTAAPGDTNRMTFGITCAENEHFLGMGGQSWDVDHRGRKVPLWVQEDGIGKDPTDDYTGTWYIRGRRHQTHTPIPLYLSSRGYAMLLDTPTRSIFDFCSTETNQGRIEAWDRELRFRLFHGDTMAETARRAASAMGTPTLPPPVVFAPWNDALFGSENVRRVAQKLRDLGIPSSVIWTEDWRGGNMGSSGYSLEEDWRVDRELYPDFEMLADDLHAQGFKFIVYNNTFVVRDADVWPEVEANGYGIQQIDGGTCTFTGVTFTDTTMIDLSNTAARAFTKSVYREGLDLGADGWMADYGEWLPTDIALASGEDPMSAHNLYPVEFLRMNRELLDEYGGPEAVWFARAGYLGAQPLVQVYWAGDQQTDWSLGDGLPSVIPMGIGLGIVGFPYFAHDIGGYQSGMTDPTTRELWYRWVTLGAMTPVMRTHHGRSAADNWNWESDAASTEHYGRWARFHMRLFPYLHGLAEEASRSGMPMMRPAALRWPAWDPGWTMTDEYMLGDRIVVAPVVEEGATTRRVRLPGGTFYPLFGGAAVTIAAGGGETTVDAPLEEIPAFVPAGTILVLLPEGVDTAAREGVTDPAVATLESVGDERELWLWPGGTGDWTEAGGVLRYEWSAVSASSATGAATWNGVPAAAVDGVVTVTGNGTLEFAGGATLEVSGRADAAPLAVRVVGG